MSLNATDTPKAACRTLSLQGVAVSDCPKCGESDISIPRLAKIHRAIARAEAERVTLSERDTRLWLDLLDNPPQPNARLIAAVKALPKS